MTGTAELFRREALVLEMRAAGANTATIAEALGIGPSSVKGLMSRARTIRRQLDHAAKQVPPPKPVVEVRDDGVRITRCPPGYALNAHFLAAPPGVRGAPPAESQNMTATIKASARLAAAKAKHGKAYSRVGPERRAQRERADAVAKRVA